MKPILLVSGVVQMLPGNRDFIDGDAAQPFQLRLPKPPFQVLLLNILDHVPTDTQMACSILKCLGLAHISRTFPSKALV